MMVIQLPETFIDEIVEQVKQKLQLDFPLPEQPDEQVLEMRRKLALIQEKKHISVAEAALLLNCSDGHIRNLVERAKKKHSKRPIPFRNFDGVIAFDRVALLAWADAGGCEQRAD